MFIEHLKAVTNSQVYTQRQRNICKYSETTTPTISNQDLDPHHKNTTNAGIQ